MQAIEITALSVRLGNNDVLTNLNLSLEKGEWLNIIGSNGAGKTTLLRCILGLLTHKGTIKIGCDGAEANRKRAQLVSYVPQVPVMPRGMAVIDYVLLGRTPHRGIFATDSEKDFAVAASVLQRLDLGCFVDREVNTLSGGERQRVVIARALAQETPIVLLDEPTMALDLGHQQEVLELINELRDERGLTVMATLHDLTLAARFGDRIALLAKGQVVASGKPFDVLTEDAIAMYFGAKVRIICDEAGVAIIPLARNKVTSSV